MAHYQQSKFVKVCKSVFPSSFFNANVIEIGSWDINGSVRSNFNNCNYVGVDVSPGPGVDLVCFGQDVGLESNSFDTVISCECFEHNEYWVETFCNMIRLLKPGGVCIITCASIGRGEHGTTRCVSNFSLTSENLGINYYKNLDISNFKKTMLLHNFSVYNFSINPYSKDLYFIGIKKDAATNNFKQLILEVKKLSKDITMEGGVSSWRRIRIKSSWMVRYFLAKLLGESRYHNFIFLLKIN